MELSLVKTAWGLCGDWLFLPPMVELVPIVRLLASRAVAFNLVCSTLMVVRSLASRKVMCPLISDALRWIAPGGITVKGGLAS